MMAVPERGSDGPAFRRYGLGWQFRPPQAPVLLTFSSVADRRGELRAEVHIETRDGGHMLRRYLNLLGSASVRDLVRDLATADGGASFPWAQVIESATESILRAVRVGPDLESFGGMSDRPPGISWLCEGLVMANVPNTWLAAASTGKSTFASLLGLHHATGRPFLGRAVSRGVTLYLDWESTRDDLAEKLWLGARFLGYSAVPSGVHRLGMRGPASMNAAAIANRIDALGATLVIWDGVQAAGGPLGQYASYESVAMDLEALIGALPTTTHVLLDHVTGDELKNQSVPLKARGGTRKVEWTRNQWSLILDRDAHSSSRHVVGWTHTKINRSDYLEPFGAEVIHRPDELGLKLLDEGEVEPLRERMPAWKQLLQVAREADHPLMNREAAELWKGNKDRASVDLVRTTVNRHPRVFARNDDGSFEPHWSTASRNGQARPGGAKPPRIGTSTGTWAQTGPQGGSDDAPW